MDGCIYRTKDGECDLYAEGGKYKAFCDMDGCDGRKMSNADRIKAMSDEELAEWIVAIIAQETIYAANKVPTPDYALEMRQRWFEWFRQECE